MKRTIFKFSVLIIFAIWGCNNSSTNTTQVSNVDSTTKVSNADSTKAPQNFVRATDLDVKKIMAVGNEPFWNLKFEDDFAVYSSPEDLDGVKVFYRKKLGDNNNIKLNEAVNKISDKD